MRKVIRLTESELHRIICESVGMVLNETHTSVLYHFTNLSGLYGILESNCIARVICGDNDYDEEDEVVCLSRSGSPYHGYCPDTEGTDLIFRIVLDGRKMMSSIRGMNIRPWSMNNPRTEKFGDKYLSVTDYEERAYQDIEPLNRYCLGIDAYPFYEGDEFNEEQIDILNKLKSDFPQWERFFRF